MKLVGGDSGHYEQEEFVDDVVLAPSERVVVDVLLRRARRSACSSTAHPTGRYPTRGDHGEGEPAEPHCGAVRRCCASNADMVAERERIEPYLAAAPDKTLAFVAEMDMGTPEGAVVLRLPDAPRGGQRRSPTAVPKCGMKLLPAQLIAESGGSRGRGRSVTDTGTSRHGTRARSRTHGHASMQPTGSNGKTTWSRSTG